MVVTGLGALLNICLNLVLIPYLSFIGAAIATVITEIFGFAFYFYYGTKLLEINWKNTMLINHAFNENCNILKGMLNRYFK